jgi:hypothetical protein
LATTSILVEAETTQSPRTGWRLVDGLGRNATAIAASGPTTLSYAVTLPPGRWQLAAEVLPTYPTIEGSGLKLAVAIDGNPPTTIAAERRTGDSAWARAVLDNRLDLALPTPLTGGAHTIVVTLDDPALILDALRFDPVPIQGLPHGH